MYKIIVGVIVMLTLILLISFPLIVLLRIMEYNKLYPTYRTKRVNISDLYDTINTGDILLFVSSSHFPANSAFSHTFFTHSAVLWKSNNNILTSESQNGTELLNINGKEIFMDKGSTYTYLLPRIKYYTGNVYIMKLKKKLDNEKEKKIINTIKDTNGYPYPSMIDIFKSIIFKASTTRHCFQHVGYILNKSGVTNLNINNLIQICKDVCNLNLSSKYEESLYNEPIHILYNIDTIKG